MVNKYPEYQIINLDLLTYAGNLETLKPVEDKPNYKFVHGDIADRDFVFKLFEEEKDVYKRQVSISSTASTASTQANKFEPCKGWVLVATLNSAFLFSSFFILKGQHEVFRNWRSGGN